MSMKARPAIAVATAAALALTSIGTAPALAAGGNVAAATSEKAGARVDEVSSRKRHKYRGHRYRNDAAAAAAVSAIIGGIAAYAAAREYRKARERDRYYYRKHKHPRYYDGPYYYRW